MGRKARLKKERSMEKLERDLRRDAGVAIDNFGKAYIISQFKEWPCQKGGRHKALLPANISPFTKDDGLLYFKNADGKEELVVSFEVKVREEAERIKEQIRKENAEKAAISSLKPTKLGE